MRILVTNDDGIDAPGLHALRHETALPVTGIQEAAVLHAMSLGQRFGILSILPASVPRHLRSLLMRHPRPRILRLGRQQNPRP